jgi:hypothetical protein
MSRWREDIAEALDAFSMVVRLAGAPMEPADLITEFHDAPHKAPKLLPSGCMAIYGFCHEGVWLKIGKAGAQSQARYTSQHYNAGSARSTLSASLLRDASTAGFPGFEQTHPGDWIKTSCCRCNILVAGNHGKPLLSLLEAFLHVRLKPRYEG